MTEVMTEVLITNNRLREDIEVGSTSIYYYVHIQITKTFVISFCLTEFGHLMYARIHIPMYIKYALKSFKWKWV